MFVTQESDDHSLIHSTNNAIDRSRLDAALHASNRRKSLLNCHRRRHRNEAMSSTNRISIVVVSDQDHPSKVYDTLITQCCSSTSFCCVTIDLVPKFDVLGSNFDHLQQETALILYNLGIAYRCVAVTHRPIIVLSTDSTTGNIFALTTSIPTYTWSIDHFTTSFQLVELSHTITNSMLQKLSVRGVAVVNVSLNLLLASLLGLYNLQKISNENECEVEKQSIFALEKW